MGKGNKIKHELQKQINRLVVINQRLESRSNVKYLRKLEKTIAGLEENGNLLLKSIDKMIGEYAKLESKYKKLKKKKGK